MSVEVISCSTEGVNKAKVTVEADTPSEAGGMTARNLAIETAGSRLSRPGISGGSGPYPIDKATGKPFEMYTTDENGNVKPNRPAGKMRFRQDFALQAAFV